MYELLTGHPPFEGQTIVEVCSKHLLAELVPPSLSAREPIPAALDELILGCLAKSPAAGPQGAAALRDQLEALTLGAWSQTEARNWWTQQAPRIVESARLERHQSRSNSPATIAIDLGARSLLENAT